MPVSKKRKLKGKRVKPTTTRHTAGDVWSEIELGQPLDPILDQVLISRGWSRVTPRAWEYLPSRPQPTRAEDDPMGSKIIFLADGAWSWSGPTFYDNEDDDAAERRYPTRKVLVAELDYIEAQRRTS